MKIAVVGSRSITQLRLEDYLPPQTSCIISGGAKGVDSLAAAYARSHGIPLLELRPDYGSYGRRAPILRNLAIIEAADAVLVFWDGVSTGSRFVIDRCRRLGKPCTVHSIGEGNGQLSLEAWMTGG